MDKNFKVIKKDGTKEDFNVQKVVVAVNKSAYRALVQFTEEELRFICQFVEEKVQSMGIREVKIAQMHNIVPRLPQLQAGFCADAGRSLQKEPVHHVHWGQGKFQHRQRIGLHQAEPDF